MILSIMGDRKGTLTRLLSLRFAIFGKHEDDMNDDSYLNLHGSILASLICGDDGDVRSNRVGRVEVGGQLQYHSIIVIIMETKVLK